MVINRFGPSVSNSELNYIKSFLMTRNTIEGHVISSGQRDM